MHALKQSNQLLRYELERRLRMVYFEAQLLKTH